MRANSTRTNINSYPGPEGVGLRDIKITWTNGKVDDTETSRFLHHFSKDETGNLRESRVRARACVRAGGRACLFLCRVEHREQDPTSTGIYEMMIVSLISLLFLICLCGYFFQQAP